MNFTFLLTLCVEFDEVHHNLIYAPQAPTSKPSIFLFNRHLPVKYQKNEIYFLSFNFLPDVHQAMKIGLCQP
jgi:hypothetical protein